MQVKVYIPVIMVKEIVFYSYIFMQSVTNFWPSVDHEDVYLTLLNMLFWSDILFILTELLYYNNYIKLCYCYNNKFINYLLKFNYDYVQAH